MFRKLLGTVLVVLLLGGGFHSAYPQRTANPPYESQVPDLFNGENNVFLGTKVTASAHWADKVPEFAVDGRHERDMHWAAENLPVWLMVDMGRDTSLNGVRIWTYWDNLRSYQYVLEGSSDARAWDILVDQRENRPPASAGGETHLFATRRLRYLRVTFTGNSRGKKNGGHVVEIEGYGLSDDRLQSELERKRQWDKVSRGLHGALGSIDTRYPKNRIPQVEESKKTWSGVAWRGERIHAQGVLWSKKPFHQLRLTTRHFTAPWGADLGEDSLQARFVRYTLGDGGLQPDILDTAVRLSLPQRSVRPLWITAEIPWDAQPGTYQGEVAVSAEGEKTLSLKMEVEVLPLSLPPPQDWAFHLDLWQNPYAVARYHHVTPWSEEHFLLLTPHLRMLAEAGQKVLTATIVHQPWGTQTYDPYESMIEWVYTKEGTWTFDYTVFDRWVEFGAECGLDRAVNCYSAIPWTNRVRYLEGKSGNFRTIACPPGSKAYGETWSPFLKDFVRHLQEKGWTDRVLLAMDERPPDQMRGALEVIRDAAPDLKIALAGGNYPELSEFIHDWCVFITPPLEEAILQKRSQQKIKERGHLQTTFYVCCSPQKPNTFTHSPPSEAAWLGLHAAARGYTGFLRWAYDSWVEDPFLDTRHVTWAAGDCFLVYPGARSSIRFERLREGIQEFEKIRLLRAIDECITEGDFVHAARKKMEDALTGLSYESVKNSPAASAVNRVKNAVELLSREVAHIPVLEGMGFADKAQALPRPTREQAEWHDCEVGMFIHFAPNTWTDREYDDLSLPLKEFNPEKLDTDQWVAAAEAMGAKYIVVVAKHAGGFCLWQTKTTDYSIQNTPWRGGKGDVLSDLSKSCRELGMKLGVYVSPCDRKFGAGGGGRCASPEKQKEYNALYRRQLEEVLTGYGEMFEIWFDGSIVVPVGDILQQHAPHAIVFQGPSATIRWVGNEDGVAPYPAWNSVSREAAESGTATAMHGTPGGDEWLPNECDARIRSTWFWNTKNAHTLKSVAQLMDMYYRSVGHGSVLLLNHTPDPTGLIPEADFQRGKEFGKEVKRRFSKSVAETSGRGLIVELALPSSTIIDHVITMEDIEKGERVREYVIQGWIDGKWNELCRGTAIGHKKIDRFDPVETGKIRLLCLRTAAMPFIRKLAVFSVSKN